MMLAYRKQQTISFSIEFLEKVFKQTQILIEHLDNSDPKQQKLKSEAIRIGSKISSLSKDEGALRMFLYYGQKNTSDHLHKENPHED